MVACVSLRKKHKRLYVVVSNKNPVDNILYSFLTDLMDSCVAHLIATLTPHSADTSHEEPVERNRINFDVTQTLGASIK